LLSAVSPDCFRTENGGFIMDITGVLMATLIVGAVGLFIGLFLGIAGMKFKVEVDEREEKILGVLPGNNCGGCGFAGCSGLAAAIVKGEAPVNGCPVGGDAVGAQVADIMGVEAQAGNRQVAFVKCQGDKDRTRVDYEYSGIEDCRMLSFVPNGGPKSCNDGCLGFGSCVKVCQFDAIHVVNGVAVVDKEACKACGKCTAVCPKNLITMIPYDAQHVVACSSREKGPVTMKACDVGCIACQLCKKNCPADAITIEDFHAVIDQEKCTGCGACKEKCPKKAII
jgi:Na+-translocating ferredoxin:NAD+ oxidoreductase RNF subunit RnfB